jgi:ABC-type transport system involved in multi-copper enzyme maturation permease subunit
LSVYKHEYRAYTGPLSSRVARLGVLVRYALAEAWSSKITVALFTGSLLPFVIFLIGIYLANNPIARAVILRGGASQGLTINATYFLRALGVQCWLAMVLTSWVAPRLITFDLADNALPILLSHPISRFDYLLGKFLASLGILSIIAWVPCLALFLYQAYSSPVPWGLANASIALGILGGSLIWIVVLSFLGLALSSWVKWRVVATGLIFAAVFVPAGVGGIASAILHTRWGLLLNLPEITTQLWQRMLGAPAFRPLDLAIPTPAILAMLLFICLVCVAMLNTRIRAREVVRG